MIIINVKTSSYFGRILYFGNTFYPRLKKTAFICVPLLNKSVIFKCLNGSPYIKFL